MGWSYRSDRSDEMYSNEGGPAVVTSVAKQTATPAAATSDTTNKKKGQIAAQGGAPTVYTADGAIAVVPHIAVIAKTSAAAMTLAAPTAGTDDGMRIQLMAGTAYAHVVTATGLIDDGVTGGAKNTVTLGAFVGASAELMAYNGHWVLTNKTVATVA